MRVKCYLNLHKTREHGHPIYSVVDTKTGRVVDHASEVNLTNVEFRVSEAGRQRVLREKAKNVHAYVCGDLMDQRVPVTRAARYNPYETETFVDRDTGEALRTAATARLGAHGVHYASGSDPVARDLIDRIMEPTEIDSGVDA